MSSEDTTAVASDRGKCRGCGWTRRIRKDGHIARHNSRDRDGYNSGSPCSGSGQPPRSVPGSSGEVQG